MSGLLVPSNHGNCEGPFAWTVYPSCELCHTRYTKIWEAQLLSWSLTLQPK